MFESAIGIKLTIGNILVNLIIAGLMGAIISWGYTKTHRGFSYSYSFASTLVLVTLIASIVIMVIGNNLARAFGLVGAFSIIRFRTVIKDTKDTVFVFLSIVIGMAIGSSSYSLGFLGLLFVLGAAFILSKTRFAPYDGSWYILSFNSVITRNTLSEHRVFKQFLKEYLLSAIRSTTADDASENNYQIQFKKDTDIEVFMQELRKIPKIKQPQLTSLKGEIPY
ncbi:MAG: DUF4956 domain-containing protein [Patescibacteria group bacterium]